MKIIDNVKDDGYTQWIEDFVSKVLSKANIKYNIATITDIEYSKRIEIVLDDCEFSIRTWNFHPIGTDMKGNTNKELVDYTLFKMVSDDTGSHGEIVCEGNLKIKWINTYEQ